MTEQNETPDPSAHPPAEEVSDFQIINGGIEIDVVKIDGSSECVKVLQLPISKIGEWGQCQAEEARLVELLCNKVDRSTVYNLTNARLAETRVQMILFQAPFEQIEEIQQRLTAIRTEIATLEAKTRWSDSITHESAARIRELGLRLNKKKWVEQSARITTDAGILEKMLSAQSPSPNSSSASPGSGEFPSAT